VTTRAVRMTVLGFIGLFAMLALAAIGATLMTDHRPPGGSDEANGQLPVLGQAPDFSLTNQAGDAFASDRLQGQVWVADFIFTRCQSICPVLTGHLSELQSWLQQQPWGDRVHLVSFSVDPTHDTPEVLRAFAEKHGADLARWDFLTAKDRAGIWPVVKDGFKLPVSANPQNAMMPINHSAKMVLVDRQGRIRGYYAGTQSDGMAELRDDLKALLTRTR
jgi:protein SCO1/2